MGQPWCLFKRQNSRERKGKRWEELERAGMLNLLFKQAGQVTTVTSRSWSHTYLDGQLSHHLEACTNAESRGLTQAY